MPRILLLVAGALLVASCYRVTVTHGPQPAAPAATVVEYPWQHSWVLGLVPPPEINVRDRCPTGVSKVQTQVSFLNGLAAGLVGAAVGELTRNQTSDTTLVWGVVATRIWEPLSVKVTCAPR